MNSISRTAMVIRSMADEAGTETERRPMRLETALVLASLAALLVTVALVFLCYGLQPDLRATVSGAPFHHKIASMLTLAGGGVLVVTSAGRPGSTLLWIAALLPAVALLCFGAVADQSDYLLLGRSGLSVPGCLGTIILLSLPALVIVMAALRSTGVVTRPVLAGAAVGILAGALAAAAYAFVCRNDGGLFIAVWYSAAIIVVAAIGAVAGRRWLIW